MSNLSQYEHLYGLVGYPLGHSFSQQYFNRKFESEHRNARYVNFEIPAVDDLRAIIAANPNLKGFNVTIPHKETVVALLDELDPEAKAIGAVNVVKVVRLPDGEILLKGYNSDHIGFSDSIKPLLDPAIHRKALILGTGGASKAVIYALERLGIECTLVSRSEKPGMITYEQISPELLDEYKVIVNATPVGMYPHVDKCPPLPYTALTSQHVCYDLVYNPDITLFMKKAAEAGAATKNGLEMLHGQAIAAWKIWYE